MGDKIYYVYIITNLHKTALYTGVTNNLYRRLLEHKYGVGSKFTQRYNLNRLVYYEIYQDIKAAISREKQIKAGSRSRKVALINSFNPEWKDLGSEIEQ